MIFRATNHENQRIFSLVILIGVQYRRAKGIIHNPSSNQQWNPESSARLAARVTRHTMGESDSVLIIHKKKSSTCSRSSSLRSEMVMEKKRW